MALDFRQVQIQVKALGERAPDRLRRQYELRRLAEETLANYAEDFESLQHKVARAAEYDPNLRCALPPQPETRAPEALNAHLPLPPLPAQATLIAADGSQIPLDRNAPVEYSLVNVGAIQMRLGVGAPPETLIDSELLYDERLFAGNHLITDGELALLRDQRERSKLADLAENAEQPVITFTDGPMEMWGGSGSGEAGAFERDLVEKYKQALLRLYQGQATAAGYVDKPRSDLVVRLLEVMLTPEAELPDIKQLYPLRGVKDEMLYRKLLAPGERSAVFQIRSAKMLQPEVLRTHFFYLNVGRPQHHWIARIEIPAWVASDSTRLDHLHAVLVDQCRILGSRPFPYLLHRAHETAVVTHQEKEQVTQMIALELRARGAEVGDQSQKQALKELEGKTGYQK